MKYKILEHKADLKMRVFGKTKEELFENAMIGMQSALRAEIQNSAQPQPFLKGWGWAEIRKIKIKSFDLTALLVDFLSEILYLIQVNKEIYNKIKFRKFSNTEIEAELFGQKVKRFDEDIKAVTYHQLDIHQKKDGSWQATILFDV